MLKEYKISVQITDADEVRLQELCRRWQIYSGKAVSLEKMLQMAFETGDAIDHALDAMEHYYPDPSFKGLTSHADFTQYVNETGKLVDGVLNVLKEHPDRQDEILGRLAAAMTADMLRNES